MSPDTAPFALFKTANERLANEPLMGFGFPGDPHRRVCRYHAQGIETLFRGSNDAGKTGLGSGIVAATCMGWKELCGEPLPDVQMPVVWWVLVQTYKQQVDASQAWLLKWLGNHPYKTVLGAKGYVEHIHIATPLCTHGGKEMRLPGFQCTTCSKIVFHCAESPSGIGGKIDGVWADEPPDEKTWREMRRRGKGDRLFYKLITATPIEEYWWHWMPGDFDDVEDRPRDGRVEVRGNMNDNRFLAAKVKAQKIADTKGDPHERARMFGDYVNIVGQSPFPADRLQAWLDKCRPPLRVEPVSILASQSASQGGEQAEVSVRCGVEIFHDPEPGELYLVVLDPAMHLRLDPATGLVADHWIRASGGSRHVPDPCGLHVYARRKPRLVARFSGYCGATGLGSLGALMHRRYNGGLADTDLTGGHGEPCVKALLKGGCRNLNSYLQAASHPMGGSHALGFRINNENRQDMVSAIQNALMLDSLEFASEKGVKSLMKVTYKMTPSGLERPEAASGANDEDMICLGRALQLMNTLRLPPPPPPDPQERLSKLAGFQVNVIRPPRHQPSRIRWVPRGT